VLRHWRNHLPVVPRLVAHYATGQGRRALAHPMALVAGFPHRPSLGQEEENRGQARASTRVKCPRAHDAERGKSIGMSAPCWGLPHRGLLEATSDKRVMEHQGLASF
jgi:hypothetical protein